MNKSQSYEMTFAGYVHKSESISKTFNEANKHTYPLYTKYFGMCTLDDMKFNKKMGSRNKYIKRTIQIIVTDEDV